MYRDNGGKVVALSDRRPGPTCNAGRLLFGFRGGGFLYLNRRISSRSRFGNACTSVRC